MTAGLTGLFCHFVIKTTLLEGLLIGAVVSSTDAASVFAVLRAQRLNLKGSLASLLEIESGSNLLSSIGSLFSGNFLGSASGVANAVESAIPDVHTRGVNGTLLSIARIPFVIETFYKITDEDRAYSYHRITLI